MLGIVTAVCCVSLIAGHGRLWDPVGRSSAWRRGFPTPVNYNDNEHFCGGFQFQWRQQRGKCGTCGDPYPQQRPRNNENGGMYGVGQVVRTYEQGQEIDMTIDITAQHQGYNEFRICEITHPNREVSDACLNRTVLELADIPGGQLAAAPGDTRWRFPPGSGVGKFTQRFRLPEGLSCRRCTLQWIWVTGNSWGVDPDGRGCLGCGEQEQFRDCADVTIKSKHRRTTRQGQTNTKYTVTTKKPTTTRTTTTTTTTTTTSPKTTRRPTSHKPSPTPTVLHSTTRRTGGRCRGIGVWSRPAIDQWCTNNCNHVPPYCPPHMCKCN